MIAAAARADCTASAYNCQHTIFTNRFSEMIKSVVLPLSEWSIHHRNGPKNGSVIFFRTCIEYRFNPSED